MAKITVEGSEATVTITPDPERDGMYRMSCSKGMWCPETDGLETWRDRYTATRATRLAILHADGVAHS